MTAPHTSIDKMKLGLIIIGMSSNCLCGIFINIMETILVAVLLRLVLQKYLDRV